MEAPELLVGDVRTFFATSWRPDRDRPAQELTRQRGEIPRWSVTSWQ